MTSRGEFDLASLGLHEGGDAPTFVRPYRSIGTLSPQELEKLRRHPFEVARAIVENYATGGVEKLMAEPGEVERLKWVGMYPQRQGGDAFMMRIKVPGGMLTAPQAREIGRVADAYGEGPRDHPMFGNNYCDLTTRQAIQIHWLHLGDIAKIWERFGAVGLTSVQACGDCARNVTSCPISGADPGEFVDSLATARAISDFFTGNRAYANLPRKFKIAVSGCAEDCARVEINDIGLWPARRSDGLIGYNVLVGGGLSDGERMASDLDVFIEAEHAVEVSRAIAQVFAELGNREHRGLARMRYLVQELGTEGFRAALEQRCDAPLHVAGEELTTSARSDHVGIFPSKRDGTVNVGCAVPVGRLVGSELIEAARLAERYGDSTVRVGVDQNLVFTGVDEAKLDELLLEDFMVKFTPNPGPFTRGIVACTGNEFCRYAVTETKERAVRLARALDAKVADMGATQALDGRAFRVHISGCSASCAQPQIGDVGLRGAVAKGPSSFEEGYDMGLGGSLGPEAGFIDWIEGAVPARRVEAAIASTVKAWIGERRDDESFTSWSRRHDLGRLRDIAGGAK